MQKVHFLRQSKGEPAMKEEIGMPPEKICKTIHQYSRGPISREDMGKLEEIARDCRQVKNYVYTRYGGIGSLSKIYPGYTVQNEMTNSGLRAELNLPSVYFYLAMFDALGDIKSQWTITKTRVLEAVNKNEGFSPDERHYLRFLLKVSNAFEAVLNQKSMELPREMQKAWEELAALVDTERLHRYLCRQVRKYHGKPHTESADGFSLSRKAYKYKDHGIYVAAKEKRKRIFIPLTDNNQYSRQIYIKLYPEKGNVELQVPVDVSVKRHQDYENQVGVALGLYTMLTTDQGHRYGEELGRYQTEYAEWVRQQASSYSRNRADNPGREKYKAKKRRKTQELHGYINRELNRFIREEKPKVIYIVKMPKPQAGGVNKKINHSVAQWQRGYIRSRLNFKCMEQSVEIVEVLGKDISSQCSSCGAMGTKAGGRFTCPQCGRELDEKTNTARNVKERGQGDGALRSI